jgi:hypothetical protein
VLYRLPDVETALERGKPVYIVEGEKDADRLSVLPGVAAATTCPGGAGKWRTEYTEVFKGVAAHVVIVQDDDEPGVSHAREVAGQLLPHVESLVVLKPKGKDLSEHLDAGLDEMDLQPVYCTWDPVDGQAAWLGRFPLEPYAVPAPRPQPAVGSEASRETSVAQPRHPGYQLMSEVQPRAVEWLWPGYIPLRHLTVLDGDPGTGKSTLALDIAARVTTGASMPLGTSGSVQPRRVLVLTAEDVVESTVRARLVCAGADLDLVATPTDQAIKVPEGLEDLLQELRPALVIIDPLMAYISPKLDSNNDQQVRQVLTPLANLAKRYNTAIVVVRHLNKTTDRRALHRGGGSIGIVGAARSGLLLAPKPDDEHLRVLVPTKSNLSEAAPAIGFRLVTTGAAARLQWQSVGHGITADVLARGPIDEVERSALDEAEDYLRDALVDGPAYSSEIRHGADELGISEASLRRAKKSLGVRSRKEKGALHGRTFLELPSDTQQPVMQHREETQDAA